MRKTAYVRQAALVATLAALALLPTLKTVLQTGAFGNAFAEFTDVIVHETMYCNACEGEQQFSVVYTQEYGQGEPVFGVHGRMTMCMNCGAVNSELPVGDSAFGVMVFQVESCTLIHGQRELSCEAADDENHLRTVVDTLQCAKCGEALSERKVFTEPHGFGEWMTEEEPTSEREGLRRRVCEACGAVQSETIEKLGPTPEPELTPEWTREPAVEPTPEVTGKPGIQTNDEPEAEPTPTPTPVPEPTPERTPRPTPEATPKPTPKPTPRQTPAPTPGATPKPTRRATAELVPTPSPDAKAGEREDNTCCCCCCCCRAASRRRYRWKNVTTTEEG